MKIIIAGSRTILDYKLLKEVINTALLQGNGITEISTIISGKAAGVDTLGKQYAIENNIPLIEMPADWNKFGKSAGYKRNEAMAQIADGLIYIHDGISKGTNHMINIAKKKNLFIYGYDTLTKKYYINQPFIFPI